MDNPLTQRLVTAAADSAVAFAWYAMPDLVRSRGARAVLKPALLAASLGVHLALPSGHDAATPRSEQPEPLAEPRPGVLAVGSVLLVASAAVAVAREKRIFARGEARRTEGVRAAHSRKALLAAALIGLAALVPSTSADQEG